jgi:hypothetical protein
MGIRERLAVVEAKLGIEPPENAYGFFWDSDRSPPIVGKLTGSENECDGGTNWEHFVPFTVEEVARFRSVGVCLSEDDE